MSQKKNSHTFVLFHPSKTMNENHLESMSIEDLEEFIRTCRENEQRLHELKRHTRHERKRAEYLLQELKHEEPIKPSVEYFLPLDSDEQRPSRVRFNLPDSNRSVSQDEELTDLSRRCEELLVRLHSNVSSPSISRQHLTERNDYEQPFVYQDMKRSTKKKYEQLPEVNERLQRELNNEIKRRNSLRAKIFRHRLRQHVLLHGRTNIDESLTILDT